MTVHAKDYEKYKDNFPELVRQLLNTLQKDIVDKLKEPIEVIEEQTNE